MTYALVTVLAAGCGYDRSPGPYDPPNATHTEGLWVASGSDPALLRLAPEQLLASGTPAPSEELLVHGHTLLSGIAFWPKPRRLPLN